MTRTSIHLLRTGDGRTEILIQQELPPHIQHLSQEWHDTVLLTIQSMTAVRDDWNTINVVVAREG